eukprot:scaffold8108_cov118-Skeletonema_dohrnii-CCMP3373.AAC.2
MSSTPLHDACKENKVSLDVILELLNDDDVMKKDQNGCLPIHVACGEKGQSLEVIKALIEAYTNGLEERDNEQRLPIHLACENGQSFEVIEALIMAYPTGLNLQDHWGRLPIHVACSNGQSLEVIKALIKERPNSLQVYDWSGLQHLPIHVACKNGQSVEVIDALIEAYPDGLQEKNRGGLLPIHVACENGQSVEVIDALIEAHPDGLKGLEVPDNYGRLPIHVACMRAEQSFEVIDALINAYPDGLKKRDGMERLPIHHACHARGMRGYNAEEDFKVIEAIIREHPNDIRVVPPSYILDVKDDYSLLHRACMSKRSFELIEGLIGMCPEALGKKSKTDRKTPFEWDYKESCGGHFKEFIQNLLPAWETLSQIDEEKEDPDDRSQADVENEEEKDRRYYRILTHCKNYVPVDILRIGFLDEKTLERRSFLEWLNGMLCRRSVVFMMVFELYLHMAWIYTFVSASFMYFESDEPLGWRPTALLVFAAIFLLEEMSQFIRLFFTGELLYYCTDLWNWIDVVTCVMVIVSAARFLDEDSSIDGRLLMTTGCLQSLLFLSYLKKTFFPFSKFVSGVIKIIWAVLPFLVVSGVTLFTFSFMYFVQDQDDKLKNTNNSNLEDDASTGDLDVEASLASILSLLEDKDSFASLMPSFQTVFGAFAGGAKESLSALDFFFGIIVVIVLLNVIIAVVSDEWAKADAEANASFWSYRLDLIIDKTRGFNLYGRLCNSYNRAAGLARMLGLPTPNIPRTLIRELELEGNFNAIKYCNLGTKTSHLDDTFINEETVGTTMEEFKMEIAVQIKERGVVACIKLLMECFVFFVLGFPTFGLLWPKFFRQMLFTPSKPKESSDTDSEGKRETFEGEIADSEGKRETFEREIANEVSKLTKKVVDQNELLTKKVVDQNELLTKKVHDQNKSLAEYKKTVSELSQKVSAQNDLLEQLLKKVS